MNMKPFGPRVAGANRIETFGEGADRPRLKQAQGAASRVRAGPGQDGVSGDGPGGRKVERLWRTQPLQLQAVHRGQHLHRGTLGIVDRAGEQLRELGTGTDVPTLEVGVRRVPRVERL